MTELSPAIETAIQVLVRNPPAKPYGDSGGTIPQHIIDDMRHDEQIHRECLESLRAAILAEQQALRTLLDDAHMLLIYAGASTQQRMDMAHRIARYLRADDLAPRSADEGE